MDAELQQTVNDIKQAVEKTADKILKTFKPLPNESFEEYFMRIDEMTKKAYKELNDETIVDSISKNILIKSIDYIRRKKLQTFYSMPAKKVLEIENGFE